MRRGYRALLKDGGELIIRPAIPSDARGFVETWEAVSREGIYLINEHAPRTVIEQENIIRYLDTSRNIIVVAVLDNRIVGGMAIFVGGMSPKCQAFCNLGIHLVKSARGRGIGSYLLAYGIEWAASKGYHKICLSVFSTNINAIRLYKKYGFVEEGIRREQYLINNMWVDEILMARFL
ncbi:MAG TPA: GNAT family N-acetyltransferase [Candidatus Atribacteria bacterium]|nr:GNAT family N-acetyltransferase [Candidatus Atribacteria bacterium]HPT78345.1 GNAT family N-acetyltransferase [Candidatus Atribacteria bacterium]